MKINLCYDYIFGNEVCNNLISSEQRNKFYFSKQETFSYLRDNSILPDFLKNNKISFNIIPSSYINPIDLNSKYFFPVEFNWFEINKKIDFNFNDSHFLMLNVKNTEFLFWYPQESLSVDSWDIFEKVYENYPHLKIKFVHGNLKTPKFITNKNYIEYIPFDYFWCQEKQFNKITLDLHKTEKYIFSFYNNRFKLHRAISYFRLMKKEFFIESESTFNSIIDSDRINNPEKDVLTKLKNDSKLEKNNPSLNKKEYDSYFTNIQFINWCISKINYENKVKYLKDIRNDNLNMNSYLDVISESSVSNDLLFITEKTYRAISRGCIFLILGNPGTLKYLKSKGIHTFDDLFDESYDDEIHWFDRWKIIEYNLDIWFKLGKHGRKKYYEKNFDKIIHNQNTIHSRDFVNEIKGIFK